MTAGYVSCSSGPDTRTVLVDNKTDKFNAAFLAYFPNNVTVHPGDNVSFKEIWTGEPHSVTMGTLVDAGLAAQDRVKGDNAAPAFAKLPTMFPDGPGDVHQNAAQPCYLDTGDPSSKDNHACSKREQPSFTGKQAYYNSGFLPKGRTFTVKLSDDIAPGRYRYYCNLHGSEMQGSITVKAKDEAIPSKSDVEAAASSQLDKYVTPLLPEYNQAKAGHAGFPASLNLAGFFSEKAQVPVPVNEFIPSTIHTKVRQKVTWVMLGFHSVTFNPTADAAPDVVVGSDGVPHVNQKSFAPAGFRPGTPTTVPAGPFSVKVTDGGAFDGTGFRSSGAGDSFPPALAGYSLTFTKAGQYPFVCLVHPGMGGVVDVT